MNEKDTLLENYHYDLPPDLIAQEPCVSRDQSRLLVFHRSSGRIEHRNFADILDYISSGDLIVFNDTKVFNARIFGMRKDTGGNVEVLLLKKSTEQEEGSRKWEVLIKPAKRAKVGTEYVFGDGKLLGDIIEIKGDGTFLMNLEYNGDLFELLDEIGEVPLPPYIKRKSAKSNPVTPCDQNPQKWFDLDRYQTIYARERGAVAAPTAGFHFSKDIFAKMDDKNIHRGFVTLHVGLGTFQPLRNSVITDNKLHNEYYSVSEETCSEIRNAHKKNKKVFAVGTTTTRTLESIVDQAGNPVTGSGQTELFIYPTYQFKLVKNMITNFHLPGTSLLVMIAALIGREELLRVYNEAVKERYRFYSYGDAMLILE